MGFSEFIKHLEHSSEPRRVFTSTVQPQGIMGELQTDCQDKDSHFLSTTSPGQNRQPHWLDCGIGSPALQAGRRPRTDCGQNNIKTFLKLFLDSRLCAQPLKQVT